MTGLAVFAHGSSVESANESVRNVAAGLRERTGCQLVETAFLEQGQPGLAEAVARLVSGGADHVRVIPYFLTLGIHLQRDLPRIVREIESIHKGIRIEITMPLDGHPALLDALADRAVGNVNGGSCSESPAY